MPENSINGITLFNRKKLRQAITYLAHKNKMCVTKFLRTFKLEQMFRERVLDTRFIPSLKSVMTIAYSLGMHPSSLVFNSQDFSPKTDMLLKRNPLKSLDLFPNITSIQLFTFTLLEYFKRNINTLQYSAMFFDEKNSVIICRLFDTYNSPCVYFYLKLKQGAIYAVHDTAIYDISKLKIRAFPNFTIVNDDLLHTYTNILKVETIKYERSI